MFEILDINLLTTCSEDISILKSKTAWLVCRATFSAILNPRAVLPIEGLPAIIIKSDFWNPKVMSSIFENPVETPTNEFPLSADSWISA